MKKNLVAFLTIIMVLSFAGVVLASRNAPCPVKISKQIILSEEEPAPTPPPNPEPAPEPEPK